MFQLQREGSDLILTFNNFSLNKAFSQEIAKIISSWQIIRVEMRLK